MLNSLRIYEASLDPGNNQKSIQELIQSEDLNVPTEAVLDSYRLWELYFRENIYKDLEGFDDGTEAEIAADETNRDLIAEIRDPRLRGRPGAEEQKEKIQAYIRTNRMAIYVGRVALFKQFEETDQNQSFPKTEVA
jgi:hypothetical protein